MKCKTISFEIKFQLYTFYFKKFENTIQRQETIEDDGNMTYQKK